MVRRYYDLPSLTALAVFEASARHLSFKLAAAELNVTPGAVSKQIKAIEDELGVPLFVRRGTGVSLTSAGEDLYGVLSSSFSRAAEVVRTIKRGDRSKNVTIACTDALATMWLIPRMADFWERFPEVTVDDTISPVCGPGFARRHRNATAEALPDLPLLHVDWVDPEWADWDEVFRRAQIPHGPNKGRRFGKFSVALQAAQADQGVAVGWHRLVRQMVRDAKLVRLTDLEMPAPGGYYLTWNDRRTLSPAAETLRSWLREMAVQERRSR